MLTRFILPPSVIGYSQECVVGVMSAERVRQLGRVAGSLRTRVDQQRIVPEISFTCGGTVDKWTVAGDWEGDSNLLEIQVWREATDGVYTKVGYSSLDFASEQNSQIYEHTVSGNSITVQAGDILGIFQPESSQLELYYANTYGPTNYYIDTSNDRKRRATTAPSGDFDINGDSVSTANNMPLVTVEVSKFISVHVDICMYV